MGMTISEKILAKKSGQETVKPGDFVMCKLDLVMATDVTAPLAIKVFHRMGAEKPFDSGRIIFINDHFVPAKDIKSAELSQEMRDFAKKHHLRYYYEVGRGGICHALMPEEGLILPGMILIGADSHTCTAGALGAFATGVGSTDLAAGMALGETWFKVPESIKIVFHGKKPDYISGKDMILTVIGELGVEGAMYMALEFSGDAVRSLPMADRFSICNMAIEAGAKTGIIEPDEITLRYLGLESASEVQSGSERRKLPFLKSDNDARYARTLTFKVDRMEPLVAYPFLPSNVAKASNFKDIRLDQVFIGSCTNGWLDDLRTAAAILKGKRIHEGVRLIITPSTARTFKEAVAEGLISIFLEAGAAVTTPTCGPCLGGHMGVLAKGEVCLATTNRNFKGRMGDLESKVYLSGTAVAAASAITGRITDPRELI
ncbi:MAG: 3-isopropylmalate dehydratase large subunit [Acidobacteriota bacterium]